MSDGGEVSVTFTSKEQAALWNSVVKLATGMRQVGGEVEGTTKKFAESESSLRRYAERLKDINATPLERLNATLERIGAASKFMDANTKERAIAAAQREYNEELAKSDEGLRQFAEHLKNTQTTPLERLRATQERITQAVAKQMLTEEQARTARSKAIEQYRAEMGGAERQQSRMIAGAVAGGQMIAEAYSAAANRVRQVFAGMAEENRRALSVQEEAGRSIGSLAQIANSPAELQKLGNQARQLVASGVARNMPEAVNTIFAANSAGAMGDLPNLQKLAAPGIIGNVPEFIRAAAALRASLGEGAGSVSDVIAKSFAAAAPTTTTGEALVIGASRAGSQAQTLGIDASSLLAATGILATARGSAEEGGTRMAALLRGLEDDAELRGKSLSEMIRAVQERGLQPEELTKQLSAEGADAFRILASNLAQLDKTIAETNAVNTQRMIDEKAAMARSDPSIAVDLIQRRNKAQADLSREAEGRVVALQEAVIEQGVTERRRGLRGGLGGFLPFLPEQAQNEISAMTFGNFMRNVFANAPGSQLPNAIAASGRTDPELRNAMIAALAERDTARQRELEALRTATENLTRAAESMSSPAPLRQDWSGPARREAAVPAE